MSRQKTSKKFRSLRLWLARLIARSEPIRAYRRRDVRLSVLEVIVKVFPAGEYGKDWGTDAQEAWRFGDTLVLNYSDRPAEKLPLD